MGCSQHAEGSDKIRFWFWHHYQVWISLHYERRAWSLFMAFQIKVFCKVIRVRWYYRPEESIGGRRQFHGVKELFFSDPFDLQSAHTIEGMCAVHSFKNYTKLENVGTEDYFSRFEYKAATGGFTPLIAWQCTVKCEMPYNPDDLMVQCEGCKDWCAKYKLFGETKSIFLEDAAFWVCSSSDYEFDWPSDHTECPIDSFNV